MRHDGWSTNGSSWLYSHRDLRTKGMLYLGIFWDLAKWSLGTSFDACFLVRFLFLFRAEVLEPFAALQLRCRCYKQTGSA